MVTINLGQNNGITCSELDLLEATLGTGIVSRPAACLAPVLIATLPFADINLKTCVLTTADSNGWTLVAEFTSLNCHHKRISDLTGLEHLTPLRTLELHNNQISDISALANLTALLDLWLQNNQIHDISALHGLTKARDIYLQDNDDIACADLDALVSILVSTTVRRPSSCVP